LTRERRFVAEALGTCLLLAAVVGSGIMAERLAAGNMAIALLCNAAATGGALIALILTFGSISGAHLNPAVTIFGSWDNGMSWPEVAGYGIAQLSGAIAGVGLANAMFGEPLFTLSRHLRTGFPQVLSEFVATFGLLATIRGCSRLRPYGTAIAVAAYIVAAYWFTASTSFANPAVTIARSLTDTFTGIRPADVPAFILAQLAGAGASTALFRWLVPTEPAMTPHGR